MHKIIQNPSINNKIFVLGLDFIKNLRIALAKKNILLSDIVLTNYNNKNSFILQIFYRHKKIKFYKNKIKRSKKKKLFSFSNFIFNGTLRKNLNHFHIYNLNKQINIETAQYFLKTFKKFKNILFARRTDLFSDFLNISALLTKGLVDSKLYLLILTQIFSIILKQKHTPYFLFLNILLKNLISFTNKKDFNPIVGAKFLITGRLKGKTRTNTLRILKGSVPCQKISANISFTKMHAHTRYGVFGLKLWINLKKYDKKG